MDDERRSKAPVVAGTGFPDDTLVEILCRVPYRSLCRFKGASRAWRDLISNPLHRCKLAQTLEGLFHEVAETGRRRRDRGGNDEAGGGNIRSQGWVGFVDLLGRSLPIVDPLFTFLSKLPGSESVRLMDVCHGLLLFDVSGYRIDSVPKYIVCNPATKQWLLVPDFGWTPWPCNGMSVHLVFSPQKSRHFGLLQFTNDVFPSVTSVQTYSSKTGAWTNSESAWSLEERQAPLEGWRYQNCRLVPESKSTVIDGMLYLICDSVGDGQVLEGDHIVAVDVEGKTRRFIPVPFQMNKENCSILSDFVGQSQGLLHYVNHEEPEYYNNNDGPDDEDNDDVDCELYIWFLDRGGDTQEMVLKHCVSFLHLFGEKCCRAGNDYNVVAIHPDHDIIIFSRDKKLITYDMNTKKVCALHTVNNAFAFNSYVPYFTESPALTNKY